MAEDAPGTPPPRNRPPPTPAPGGVTPAPGRRWNTTPNWQDPFTPPQPGDAYWAEWIAANPTWYDENPGYPRPTGTPTPTPTPGPGGTPPPSDLITYDEAIAHAHATAGTAWGRSLTAADIQRLQTALGYTPGAQIHRSALVQIDNWINANHPPPGGPPGPKAFGNPPPGPAPTTFGGTPPTYQKPDAYTPGTFTGPTAADLMTDPSMKFRFDQGLQATQGQAASKGLLNTGGTLKDLLAYGQDFGSQEYKNVFDRSLSSWQNNEASRFSGYTTNVQNQNNLPYTNAADMFKNQQLSGQRAGEFNYNSAYNQWVQQYNMWRNNQNDWWNHATQVT